MEVSMGNMLTVFFKKRHKHIINQQEAIVGFFDNGGNFMRMEAKIQGVQNAASARNAEKGFQVAGVIPHHGGDAVTGPQTEIGQPRSEPARAPVDLAVAPTPDGLA